MMESPYENLEDEELILRYRAGDEAVLDYLLDKYKNPVRSRARALFLAGGETDDLIQEGMIGLFKAVRDYETDKGTAFRSFASLCIERQMLSAVQNSNRKKHSPLNSSVSLDADPENEIGTIVRSEDNPEEILIDRENAEVLEGKMREFLSPLENDVLDLYLEGYSYADIGEKLNKSPKSVDNALRRIRGKIRDNVTLTNGG